MNIMSKLSESFVFNVFVVTGTVHYVWYQMWNVWAVKRNVHFVNRPNDKLYCLHSFDYSDNDSDSDSDSVKQTSLCFKSDWTCAQICGKLIAESLKRHLTGISSLFCYILRNLDYLDISEFQSDVNYDNESYSQSVVCTEFCRGELD